MLPSAKRTRLETVDIGFNGNPGASQPIAVCAEEQPESNSVLTRIHRYRHPLGSGMMSMAFHTALLLVLMWVVLNWQPVEKVISITSETWNDPKPQITRDDAQQPMIEIALPVEAQSLLEDPSAGRSLAVDDPSGGHQDGSWFFRHEHGPLGRLYTTAMAVMILEVYYRYLPLVERGAK